MKEKTAAVFIQFHKILIGLDHGKVLEATLVGIEMSKVFDTIKRLKLMNMLKEVYIPIELPPS